MSGKATVKTVILFEDEIRFAAQAMKAYFAVGKDAPDAVHHAHCEAFVLACATALADADTEGAVLLLGRKPDFMRQAGKTGKAK